MKRRGLRLLIALGVGGGLVGLAAVLVRVTRLHNFYAVCLGIGLIAIGLAVAALVSPNVLMQRATGDPYFGESSMPPTTSASRRMNIAGSAGTPSTWCWRLCRAFSRR